MKDLKENKKTVNWEKVRAVIARVLLLAVTCACMAYVFAETNTEDTTKRLQNGSFEEGQKFTDAYKQIETVANWNTTAFQRKFELFRDNPSTYLTNPTVRLTPTDGTYAAELNADEESPVPGGQNATIQRLRMGPGSRRP